MVSVFSEKAARPCEEARPRAAGSGRGARHAREGRMTVSSWFFNPTDNLATLIGAGVTLLGSGLVVLGLVMNARQWRSEAASRRHQEFESRIERFQTPKTRAAI